MPGLCGLRESHAAVMNGMCHALKWSVAVLQAIDISIDSARLTSTAHESDMIGYLSHRQWSGLVKTPREAYDCV